MNLGMTLPQLMEIVFVAVVMFMGTRIMSQGKEIDALKLEIERDFQRKDGLKEMIREAVSSAIEPLKVKIEHAIDEIDAGRRDTNTILDKLEWPAVRRDDKR